VDRRVAVGFLLAGVSLCVALERAIEDRRRRGAAPAWTAARSWVGVVEVEGAVRMGGVFPGQAGRLAREAIAPAGPRVPPRGEGAQARLREGDAITLLPDGSVRVTRMPGERLTALGLRIDLNRATAEDLASLPGIGPTGAARIVEHRGSRGPFRTVDDLRRVPGIGPKTLARVRPLLRVDHPSSRMKSDEPRPVVRPSAGEEGPENRAAGRARRTPPY